MQITNKILTSKTEINHYTQCNSDAEKAKYRNNISAYVMDTIFKYYKIKRLIFIDYIQTIGEIILYI